MKSGRAAWLVRLVSMAVVLTQACENEQPAPAPQPPTWVEVCVDVDGDGYGFQCEAGPDCDDADPAVYDTCETSCTSPREGCACDESAVPVECTLPYELTPAGSLLCSTGTRYCRDQRWTACEGIKTFSVPPGNSLLTRAILNGDAGNVTCAPCSPDCYRVDDELTAPDGGFSGGLVSGPSGGITLDTETVDAAVPEPPLLGTVDCTPGVAPDFDCDGIPDDFDPYPSQPPFASDYPTIFMDLAPGQTKSQSFDLQFYVNTADIYFYIDMTASMEGERDNLIASLTTGNFLPNAGAGIECADRDFNGTPDNQLKTQGIAGNIACLIRDSNLGAGWFRDIPFVGPYANGIRIASEDFEIFEHRQDITSDVVAVRDALSGFQTDGNQNVPEGSMQGLWSLVTGQQLYTGWDRPGVPARTGCPAGTWGYACFRDEAVPIIIHIGDAPLQNGPSPTTASRANYLDNCVNECTCTQTSCVWGFCWCAQETCNCGNAGRHPLNYDNNALSGMRAGSDTTYRTLTSTAETLATAQDVGAIENVLITYGGTTEGKASDLTYASAGNCPSGSAWSSTSQGGRDIVFRFRVNTARTLTVSTRGSRFNTALMIKRVSDGAVLACNDDVSNGNPDAEINRNYAVGDYYAILKGRTNNEAGWYQITFGDKNRQNTSSYAAKTWLGPAQNGAGGVREALLNSRARVISVNSSTDVYLAEQTTVLSQVTNALSANGQPLTFNINTNGTGMGAAVIDAVNLLAGNLAMDVGVVLRETPDNPTPNFGFLVEAIDRPGDLCDPPIDTDGDPQQIPDTHRRCRPGAAPLFRVSFTNPPAPNNVPLNPADANGGYSMRLELIGDGSYVVDRIPVYIIPEEVIPPPATTQYAASASYEQTVAALGCVGNEAPLWSTLHWNAGMPSGTSLRWDMCAANSEAELPTCALSRAAAVHTGAVCTVNSQCPGGACAPDGLCRYVEGPACTAHADCGTGGTCVAQVCRWSDSPADVRRALLAGQQGRKFLRVRTTLNANADRTAAPTLFDWRVDYTCSAQE